VTRDRKALYLVMSAVTAIGRGGNGPFTLACAIWMSFSWWLGRCLHAMLRNRVAGKGSRTSFELLRERPKLLFVVAGINPLRIYWYCCTLMRWLPPSRPRRLNYSVGDHPWPYWRVPCWPALGRRDNVLAVVARFYGGCVIIANAGQPLSMQFTCSLTGVGWLWQHLGVGVVTGFSIRA